MTETKERERVKPALPKAKATPATPARSPASRPGWMERLGLRGGAATQQRKPSSGIFKFMFGLIVFVVGSQLLAFVLFFLDGLVGRRLSTLEIFPPSVPLIGGMTLYLLVYFLLVVGLWYVLYKTNIIPRDPFGVKTRAAEQARAAGGARGTAATPGSGKPRTRAERRRLASETAAAEAAKSSAKNATRAPAKPVAAKAAPARANGKAAQAPAPGHDAEYERVRAADRQRRRRAAKR